MWEDEKKRQKGKSERLFSNGVVILVFLILAAQSVFFTVHLIGRHRTMKEMARDTVVVQETRPPESPAPEARKVLPPEPAPARTAAAEPETVSASRPAPEPEKPGTPTYNHDGWVWDRVELNSADSAALDALPGIGPYYARQIISYRERLGYYADISQLLDIRGFDSTRLGRLTDRIYIDPVSIRPLDLYSMSADSLAAHPYIGPYAAKGIDRLRRTVPEADFSFQTILDSNILPQAQARRLALYFKRNESPRPCQ